MIDTSVFIAGLIEDHEFHDLARPSLTATTRVHVIVMAGLPLATLDGRQHRIALAHGFAAPTSPRTRYRPNSMAVLTTILMHKISGWRYCMLRG